MRPSLAALTFLALLCACSSPPKPPGVDQSKRHPANTSAAVELQVCKGDLQNTRSQLGETTRLAEAASATATRLSLQAAARAPAPEGNGLYVLRFAFGSAQVVLPAGDAPVLIEQARQASLIVLRGRTDGEADVPAEGRVARERALAVRGYLVQSGVDPSRIRVTWQPIGDTLADNGSPAGRAANRRVEVELYRQPLHSIIPDRVAAAS